MSRNDQEKPYTGLLGLDELPLAIKVPNFLFTVLAGTVIAFFSYFSPVYFRNTLWPFVFLFAWPGCVLMLWLRLTGIKWHWGLLAVFLVFILFSILESMFESLAASMG